MHKEILMWSFWSQNLKDVKFHKIWVLLYIFANNSRSS